MNFKWIPSGWISATQCSNRRTLLPIVCGFGGLS